MKRLPSWLSKKLPPESATHTTHEIVERYGLHTVCAAAQCPNLGECFSARVATFLILGEICTRGCRFCAVEKGKPYPPDSDEPARVVAAARELGLRHVVITSVTRDDLPDGGAEQFVKVINRFQQENPLTTVEVLTPDFNGKRAAVECVTRARPQVFAHNLETIPRLYSWVRPQADYNRSLKVLAWAKQGDNSLITKSGLMVGLGETPAEVKNVLRDLRAVGCDVVTIGQYLRPSPHQIPVVEYVNPARFMEYEALGYELGFKKVMTGPFVRSSYQADACLVSV
ncbi:MAG: lipoyl synthase [Firmicutes bacterium]|nr:lipoyl synthase [Bacillota bacterium]